MDEFDYIVKNFPKVKEIGIEDDCFTAKSDHVQKICELLINRKSKIKWYCNVRGDVNSELLKLMKRAGCRLVTVGFESACQRILDNIPKNAKVETYRQFVRDAHKANILVHGCIMTGNPGDTKETLKEGYEFAKSINCDSMQFYPLYLYPGTKAYTWAEERGYLRTTDYSEWVDKEGMHNCILDTPEMKSGEMIELCDLYLKKYHLRPSYIFAKLRQAFRNPSEGYRSIKSAKIFLSNNLSKNK